MPSQLRLDLGEPDETPSPEPVAEKPVRKKRSRKKDKATEKKATEPESLTNATARSEAGTIADQVTATPVAAGMSGDAAVRPDSAPAGGSSARAFLYARGASSQPQETGAPPPDAVGKGKPAIETTEARPLKVAEVTARIKSLLEGDTVLCRVTVEGEISNLNRATSGHVYLTLKDEQSTLRATIWAAQARRIRASFQNGTKVIATGSISVYLPRGEYQLIISDLRIAGLGALYEAFEKLKARLQQEGLFDPARKVPLPYLPRGVGIVTSPKGAVVKDIYNVIRRRYPNMPLYLVPVKVQGEGAAAEIVAGIRRLDVDPRVDVIIVGRGGGSLEDLWAFNEEPVARAIAAAVKPIISAVGHETDVTIADFVADRRAATPSQAGEFAVPMKDELARRIGEMYQRLKRNLLHRLEVAKQRLGKARACRFLAKPELLIAERRNTVANLIRDVETLYKNRLLSARHRFELAVGKLKALSPRAMISERRNLLLKLIRELQDGYKRTLTSMRHRYEMRHGRLVLLNPRALLQRGYILAQDGDGRVITSIQALSCDQTLTLHLRDGRAETRVTRLETEPKEPTS